jgi:hypothetical protein
MSRYDRHVVRASRISLALVLLALLAPAASAAFPAPLSGALAPKAVNLPVTNALRTALRGVFLRRNPTLRSARVAGPLWGRACVEAMEEMFRSRCVEYTRYRGWEYASALFVVDGARPNEQTFTRRVGSLWRAAGRYGYAPPLPCPVLRAWGREC